MRKLLAVLLLPVAALAQIRIVAPAKPSTIEALAAGEVRRYFYLRTGQLLPITNIARGDAIVIRKDPTLATDEYILETRDHVAWLRGGGDTGILYAAYRFAEHLGVRFYLHGDVIPDQIAATDTPGELGTLANLEQHSRGTLQFLTAQDAAIVQGLGKPLPESVELAKAYTGPARIIVPTVRTLASKGESLNIKLMAIDREPVGSVAAWWRPLGKGTFRPAPVKHLGRAVYTLSLPPLQEDIEYYIQAETSTGKKLTWPAAAPGVGQTIVVCRLSI